MLKQSSGPTPSDSPEVWLGKGQVFPSGFIHSPMLCSGITVLEMLSSPGRVVVTPGFFWYVLGLMVELRRFLSRFRKKPFPYPFVYSDAYWMVDLGNHVFSAEKYRMLYERLLRSGARRETFKAPEPASDEDILLVHTPRYLKKLKTGRLSPSEIMTLELPFRAELLDFAQLMVGGTITAARLALDRGLSVHLGGGFHHAFPDHGEGFCILNDVAIALKKLQREQVVHRALIIDCDVHQGNGTAEIFSGDDRVFTFSLHQMDIYPAQKARSTLDIGLWSGDDDTTYLEALQTHIPRMFREFQPEFVFYLAGADPYIKDQLGGLNISVEGLEERDRIVLDAALRNRVPTVVLLAGGYAYDVAETVAIHFNTLKVCRKLKKKYG
ncbi:MAG: histone deacetylase [Candidatus Aminicenantales bacterium]